MKRIILFILLFIGTACTLIAYVGYRYYAPPRLRKPYQMKKPDDTLRIAYIGDSWAFFHHKHECIIPQILEGVLHRPIMVYSYGICGLTSKEIYENMFDNYDFRHFLQMRSYEYCFISAGINDTYKKMSTSYYQQSMDGIIQMLLTNHIRPIILEIPDYDIQRGYAYQQTGRKMLRQFSMFINNTSLDCKQQFRDALDELFKTKGYRSEVSIVHYKTWNNNYQNDLQQLYVSDGMHLNSNGYTTLDSIIAKVILTTRHSNVRQEE